MDFVFSLWRSSRGGSHDHGHLCRCGPLTGRTTRTVPAPQPCRLGAQQGTSMYPRRRHRLWGVWGVVRGANCSLSSDPVSQAGVLRHVCANPDHSLTVALGSVHFSVMSARLWLRVSPTSLCTQIPGTPSGAGSDPGLGSPRGGARLLSVRAPGLTLCAGGNTVRGKGPCVSQRVSREL